MEAPLERWKEVRQEIHDQVCDEGFNASMGSFTQYYGSDQLDASLLMIPLVGFLPAHDPRVRGTIEAIERDLVDGGFVLRYRTADTGDVDGLSGREGAFLACSFWLADCLSMLGRDHDARQLLDRLMGLRNDLGLLAEEYDPVAGRMVGNFPQAFSHVSLVNSAAKLMGQEKPSSEHVILGLARRALTRGRSTPAPRHLGGVSAQAMVTRLAGNAGSSTQRGAARLVQEAVSGIATGPAATTAPGTTPAASKRPSGRRSRPTTKPTAKKAAALATKAPVTPSGTPPRVARSTATKSTTTKGVPAPKGRTQQAGPAKAATKKAATKKSAAKKVGRAKTATQGGRGKKAAGTAGKAGTAVRKVPATKATLTARDR